MPINWVDVPDPTHPPAGAVPMSAANLGKLAVIADIGTAGTPTGDALTKSYGLIVSLKSFGAVGDGVTDDSAAIKSAEAALTSGMSLVVPKGSYRFAQQNPAGGAAFLISGKSNVALIFEPGAEILLDNLSSGSGTSHGIAVTGQAADITLMNPKVRWKTAPSTRSTGDGFHFLGYPSDSAPAAGWTASTGKLSNVRLINGTTINAPQTGAIFMGCTDPVVQNFRAESTLADGLHFNACRRVRVDGHTAFNTGDDGLAFVTYYHASSIWQTTSGPFNQPSLGDWSNGNSVAAEIIVRDGSANGCRISGSKDVAVTGLNVNNKPVGGLMVDAAIANGSTINWSYQASTGVAVSNAVLDNCPTGLHVVTQNIDSSSDASFWTFGARLDGITVRSSTNWSVRVEGNGTTNSIVSGLHLTNIRVTSDATATGGGKGGVSFSSLRNTYINGVWFDSNSGADCQFFGQDSVLTGALSTLPTSNLAIGDVYVTGGRVLFQDMAGVNVGRIVSRNSPGDGIDFNRVRHVKVGTLRTDYANRANSGIARGVMVNKAAFMDVAELHVTHDGNVSGGSGNWRSLEIGGGDATDVAANGLHVEKVAYINTLNQTTSDVTLQGGSYGPVNHYARVQFYNGGEASPVWRTQTVGTLPVF